MNQRYSHPKFHHPEAVPTFTLSLVVLEMTVAAHDVLTSWLGAFSIILNQHSGHDAAVATCPSLPGLGCLNFSSTAIVGVAVMVGMTMALGCVVLVTIVIAGRRHPE